MVILNLTSILASEAVEIFFFVLSISSHLIWLNCVFRAKIRFFINLDNYLEAARGLRGPVEAII